MRRHIAYLKYLLKHKYYVYIAGRKIGMSHWQLFIHDWSKFLPSEWIPYANNFYDDSGNRKQWVANPEFDRAWLHHIHFNKHHWQHWILQEDSGDVILVEMPNEYVAEMVADWAGAGKAITGKWDLKEWYGKNKNKIKLNDITRTKVEYLIDYCDFDKISH